MKLKYSGNNQNTSAFPIPTTCPHCGHKTTLDSIGPNDILLSNIESVYGGQRACSNVQCRGHAFVVHGGASDRLLCMYPATRIAFDNSAVPIAIVHAFDEALECHAIGCYTAAAIMIRRTLEELCAEREAAGKNLKERLESLGTKIVLPAELLAAADELRLLGNDAAHIEATEYAKVEKEELDVAIEFTKEILKGIYQYASLLEKLRSLKKVTTPDPEVL